MLHPRNFLFHWILLCTDDMNLVAGYFLPRGADETMAMVAEPLDYCTDGHVSSQGTEIAERTLTQEKERDFAHLLNERDTELLNDPKIMTCHNGGS